MTALRFAWERQDDTLQPAPLECQWCGADLAQGPHRPVCRVVLEVDELAIPKLLDRRRRPGQVYATWCDECPYLGGCGNCQN